MSLLYYAPGGGLGHVSRAVKVLRYIKKSGLIITSPLPIDIRPQLPEGVEHLAIPEHCQDQGSLAGWLQKQLRQLAISKLIIDSFPAGIFGELGAIALPEQRVFVSRLLNWPSYSSGINAIPCFKQTWYCEWPAEDQELAMSHLCGSRYWLPLLSSPPLEMHSAADNPRHTEQDGLLVIHSDLNELTQLLPRDYHGPMTLVSPAVPAAQQAQLKQNWPQLKFLQQYPTDNIGWDYPWLRCAAGFNLMHEYVQHPGAKFIALKRRFDLQQLRLDRGIHGMLPPNGMPLLTPERLPSAQAAAMK